MSGCFEIVLRWLRLCYRFPFLLSLLFFFFHLVALVLRWLRDGEEVAADLADVLGALNITTDYEECGDDEEEKNEEDFTDIALIFDAVLPEVPHWELLPNHLEEKKRVKDF